MKRHLLLTSVFLISTICMEAQQEVLSIIDGSSSGANGVLEQFLPQKQEESSLPFVTVETEYVVGEIAPENGKRRALAIFKVTPNAYTVRYKGGLFWDATIDQYGYDYIVEYCRSTEEADEIHTSAYSDTIMCYSGDIIHAIFIAEDADGNQSEPIHHIASVPLTASTETVNYNDDLHLFPIPSNGDLTISVDNLDENAKIDIFSTTGTKVYSADLSSSKLNINLPNLSDGIYLVQYTSKKRSMVKHLLVKR